MCVCVCVCVCVCFYFMHTHAKCLYTEVETCILLVLMISNTVKIDW